MLDFLDGEIEDPFEAIRPYRIIVISPVAFHEVLRSFPLEEHVRLIQILKSEMLPPPSTEHWIEAARVMRLLYPKRQKQNIARMQNDILIALAAKEVRAPLWTRDSDFDLVCGHLKVERI